MRIKYEKSFLKDLRKINERDVKQKIEETISIIKVSKTIPKNSSLKKIQGHQSAYRLKINNYRLGFFLENDIIIFVRCLNRKDIYKYFP